MTDIDGDMPTFTATGLPPGLRIDPVTGLITGTLTPDASQGGPYTRDTDLSMMDTAARQRPLRMAGEQSWTRSRSMTARSVKTGKDVTVDVLANDHDPDGDTLTVTTAQATNGTVDILPDGSIKYTPRPGFTGIDRITYVISDGNGGHAIASVTITVDDDGYTEKPPVFGFNGPENPRPGDRTLDSIAAYWHHSRRRRC